MQLERLERLVVGAAVTLILYTATLSLLGPVVLSAQTNKTFSNSGSVKGIGVGIYFDQACTNPVSSISWGIMEPGTNKNQTVYIRNEGNSAATISKATSNWNPPEASNYLTLNWNYAGQTLSVNQVLQVKFTLIVSSSVSGITNFSFDIIITATG